jgi:hypothetical protein
MQIPHPHHPVGNAHHKPSSPIDIPNRRKHQSTPICSPCIRPTSPDLIFEMSPVDVSPPSANYYLDAQVSPGRSHVMPLHGRRYGTVIPSTSSRPSNSPHEPFMYCFPTLPHQTTHDSRPHQPPEVVTSPMYPHENVLHIGRPQRKAHSYLTSAFLRNDEEEFPLATRSRSPSRTGPELTPTQPYRTPLSRTPRKSRPILSSLLPASSFQSNRSVIASIPGKMNENFSPEEANASSFEFEKYLVRRIEEEKRVRYRRATISSMAISVRTR